WFLGQLAPGMVAYNIPFPMRLRGPIEPAVLAASLAAIRRRHEVLRTNFQAVAGKPVMTIAPFSPGFLPLVDLTPLPAAVREREAARLVDADRRRPIDLARGDLLRAALLKLGSEDHLVTISAHHIVFDGWSLDVMIREMVTFYQAFHAGRNGQTAPLPEELSIQYGDYAHWQRQWLDREVCARQLAYWKEQLAGAPPTLELPADRPRPAHQSFRGKVLPVALDQELAAALAARGRQQQATPYMTLLAAFATLLYRYTGRQDVVVGSPIAGRNRKQLEGLIGFFVNTLVMRVDLTGDASFRELLARVRTMTLDAYAHQDLPFERLVEELHVERDAGINPLFQVMFAVQNFLPRRRELSDLTFSPLPPAGVTAKFDLALVLPEESTGMVG
ncbi:MAG: non-ribosomal peptide synthetase, partial [bacterium]|nr:non-ribosomal peptide synthetase [bacterium]